VIHRSVQPANSRRFRCCLPKSRRWNRQCPDCHRCPPFLRPCRRWRCLPILALDRLTGKSWCYSRIRLPEGRQAQGSRQRLWQRMWIDCGTTSSAPLVGVQNISLQSRDTQIAERANGGRAGIGETSGVSSDPCCTGYSPSGPAWLSPDRDTRGDRKRFRSQSYDLPRDF
jgi:hypothetical protein